MSLEIFLLLLLIVSIFTGLFTEGIKKLMDEVNTSPISWPVSLQSYCQFW